MVFDWDDANRAHVAAHRIAPKEAEQVIQNEPFDLEFQTEDGEERFVQIGETSAGRVLVVISIWRAQKVRVVTAFEAPKAMKTMFFVEKGKLYGSDSEDS